LPDAEGAISPTTSQAEGPFGGGISGKWDLWSPPKVKTGSPVKLSGCALA
jgi:hypothetical protein